jgi:hypothetical protein
MTEKEFFILWSIVSFNAGWWGCWYARNFIERRATDQ